MVRTAAEAAVAAMRSAVTGEPIEPDPDDQALDQGQGDTGSLEPKADLGPALGSHGEPQADPQQQPDLHHYENQQPDHHQPDLQPLAEHAARDPGPNQPLQSVQAQNQPPPD